MALGMTLGVIVWLGMGLQTHAFLHSADIGLVQVSAEQELGLVLLHETKQRVVYNKTTSRLPDWLLAVESDSGACVVHGSCVVGTHFPGTCTLKVDAKKAEKVWSTSLSTSGEDALVFNGFSYQSNRSSLLYRKTPTSDIVWTSQSDASMFTLCWYRRESKGKAGSLYGRPGPASRHTKSTLADKCLWVNGLCWLWAAPCSGSCASVTLGNQHPGELRYANMTEWRAAYKVLNESRATFHTKCAAGLLISPHDHCDATDLFSQHGPTGEPSSDELVLIYEYENATVTTVPPQPSVFNLPKVQATGDPHLVNQFGQRFDLYHTGVHTLLSIPRGAGRRQKLLKVKAYASQVGGTCADVYFTALNVSGRWVASPLVQYLATSPPRSKETSSTRRFGQVAIKVVWGHTVTGVQYLNLFVKDLNLLTKRGISIGGLLGEDDHTFAATPGRNCRRTLSLLQE